MGGNDEIQRKRGIALQFSLAALLLLVTASCLAFGLWRLTGHERVVALLEVRPAAPAAGQPSLPISAQEAQRQSQAQLALVRSPLVIASALQAPGIAALPNVTRQSDPTTWLTNRLYASFASGSPILELRLDGARDEGQYDAQILQSVIDSWKSVMKTDSSTGSAQTTIRVIQPPVVTTR